MTTTIKSTALGFVSCLLFSGFAHAQTKEATADFISRHVQVTLACVNGRYIARGTRLKFSTDYCTITEKIDRYSRNYTRILNGETYKIPLSQINPGRIRVAVRNECGATWYQVEMFCAKGNCIDGIRDSSDKNWPFTADPSTADRAAKALAHLANLCGAKSVEEPF